MPWGLCSRGWMLKGAVTLLTSMPPKSVHYPTSSIEKALSYNHHSFFYFGLSQLHWRLLNLTWQVKLFVLQKWKLRRSDWWEICKQGEWRSYSRRLDIRLHSTLDILSISCEYLFQLLREHQKQFCFSERRKKSRANISHNAARECNLAIILLSTTLTFFVLHTPR